MNNDNALAKNTEPYNQADASPDSIAMQRKGGLFSVHLWKSRMSWRIALTSFAAILIVQMLALGITIHHFEGNKLATLRENTRNYVLTSIKKETAGSKQGRIEAAPDNVLSAEATVTGVSIYDTEYNLVNRYGHEPETEPKASKKMPLHRRVSGGAEYELYYAPEDLSQPYHAVVRVQTDIISPLLIDHLYTMAAILLLLSVMATGFIMLALGQWLLEPILVLSANLTSAVKNAEKPNIRRLKKDPKDEVGMALKVANDLIRQNANNLKRLRAQAEDKIHKLAYYDTLTGLPNRTFFIEKLDDAIKKKVVEESRRMAVFCVDLDHFKDINDTMGHEFGDKLLEAVGRRLVKAMPPDAVIARASADEFSIMVLMSPGYPDSQSIAESIFDALSDPVSIMNEQFQIRVSVGVSHCPDDGMEGRQILKNADIALNRAKEEGRDTIRYYSEEIDIAVQHRFQILRDLRKAIDNEELQLFYQPQIDLKTGEIIGAEALLRWFRKNEDGSTTFISPADFIPIAEQSSLIVPIGEWVLKTACTMNKQWQNEGLPPFRMAINISGVQFHRANIVELVRKTLHDTALEARYLELEVTESIFMENIESAIDTLKQLNDLGCEIAIDDFGTGYSSLSYLRQFPIDRLKIDQSFMRNALTNADDKTIARTIISLGHSLDLRVIAEGVETAEHEQFLIDEGCDEVQGYRYCKPIAAEEFKKFVVDHTKRNQPPRLALVEGQKK